MPIPIDTNKYTQKGHSIGFSHSCYFRQPRSVTPVDFVLKGDRLVYVGNHLGCHFNLPELMAQISFVQEPEILGAEKEKAINVLVFTEGLSDVIHLQAIVLSAWVCNKQDSSNRKRSRHNVNIISARSMQNGMKLRFNENFRTLPNRPANDGISAVFGDVILDEREAFILWHALQRSAGNIKRRSIIKSNHLTSKSNDIRFNKFRRSHVLYVKIKDLPDSQPLFGCDVTPPVCPWS
jgi:hypothetical protein